MSLEKEKSDLCLTCLACCKALAIPTPYVYSNAEFKEFYRVRGCGIVPVTGEEFSLVWLRIACPHLTIEGCDIYEDRPEWCKKYDGRLDPLMKDICKWEEL